LVAVIAFTFCSIETRTPLPPSSWDVLAPFPAGTRETGADPLNAYGGIFKIKRADPSASYPSDLVNGGVVTWTKVAPDNSGNVNIGFNSSYVNWDLIEGWAGLAGAQFKGWAIGDFTVDTSGTYIVFCTGVDNFYVDDVHLRGDVYGLGYGIWAVKLTTGTHSFYVPFGGMEGTSFNCNFTAKPNPGSNIMVKENYYETQLSPNVVLYNGQSILASPFFAINVLNMDTQYPLSNLAVSTSTSGFKVTYQENPTLAPGQASQVVIRVAMASSVQCSNVTISNYWKLLTNVTFTVTANNSSPVSTTYSLECRTWNLAYRFTFLDGDQSVQYAVARPPVYGCSRFDNKACPILFSLHGAGVDADGGPWLASYQQQNYSWTLLPTNRGIYGFDWQGAGRVNALKARDYLAQALPGVPADLQSTYRVDSTKIIYAGHSMGGHGCWVQSTHYPDRALAVVPAAGWIKMQMYIPSFLNLGGALASPYLNYILEASISEYNTDFYSRHLVGIPLMVRMGSDDDNVPPYHLRRMARIVDELNGNPNTVKISEVPGQGHWWWGITDDDVMQGFFDRAAVSTLPSLPNEFIATTLNPVSSESRGGIQILQLHLPYRAGYVHVTRNVKQGQKVWRLRTENIRRLGFIYFADLEQPTDGFYLDNQFFQWAGTTPPYHYYKTGGSWKVSSSYEWLNAERSAKNYGPLAQVLEGPITVVYGTQGGSSNAQKNLRHSVYLSSQMYYQGLFKFNIVSDVNFSYNSTMKTNLILIGGPDVNRVTAQLASLGKLPVTFNGKSFKIHDRVFNEEGVGIAFLAPLDHGIAAVFAGNDDVGIERATGLFPTKSAITIPDYAVVGREWTFQGASGFLAAGFWDNEWKYNKEIGYIRSY
jgi:hypothetical protein